MPDPGVVGDTKLELVEAGRFRLRWRNPDEHGDAAIPDGTVTGIGPPRLLEISAGWAPAPPASREPAPGSSS